MEKVDLTIREASEKDVPEMLELVRKYERYDEEYENNNQKFSFEG